MKIFVDLFEVTSTPHGEAPEWVRKAWVGCVLPASHLTCGHIEQHTHGVVSREPEKKKIAGVATDTGIALQVLAVHSEAAAHWFESNGYPREGEAFLFKTEDVQVITRRVPEPDTRISYWCEIDRVWK